MTYPPCSWCGRKNQLYIGPGGFRDFDSDLADGIPVCGGCGGCGVEIDTPDFRQRAEEIKRLRFAYCPTDAAPHLPGIRAKILRQLVTAVSKMYDDFGEGRPCLAKQIKEGALNKRFEKHEREVDATVAEIQNTPANEFDPMMADLAASKLAYVAYARGEVDEAEQRFRALIERFPDNSILHKELGSVLVNGKDDPVGAYALFARACQLEPKRAIHFVQAGRTLIILNRPLDAIAAYHGARGCPDIDTLPANVQAEINGVLDALSTTASA